MNKKLFALFGNPVSHSKSPLLHNALYRELSIDACYTRYLLEDGRALREKLFSLGLCGANVTVPFKEDAYSACDELDMFAKDIGAVNTIVTKNEKLYGYNTDAPGFIASLGHFSYKSALILGAGGTARAIAFALRDSGIEPLVANRSKSRLGFFLERGFATAVFDELKPAEYDIVINTTSAGLADELLPLPMEPLVELFNGAKLAYDCIYRETPFLRLAKEMRIDRKGGIDMLIWQAFFAFEIFVDTKIDKKYIEVMKSAAN